MRQLSRKIKTIAERFNYAKVQAKKRGIRWDLTKTQFEGLISKSCFYCNGDLPGNETSLDRIKNDKDIGYTERNVVPCCKSCGQLRGDRLTVSETKAAVLAAKEQRQRVISDYFEHNVHIDLRKIFISGEIGSEMATEISKAMDELESINSNRLIEFKIMSEGGSWTDALAIYDRILQSPCPTLAIGTGLVASAATIILQAVNERVLSANARVLIHDGHEGFEGSPRSFQAWAKASQADLKLMYEIYAKRSGHPSSYWEEKCSHDTWLTAQGAVKEGLADRILDPVKKFKRR